MVAEVGVHVDEEVVAVVHGVAHAGEDGGAQAELAGAVQDVDARVGGGELVGERPVPSGELSSITSTSAAGSVWWISRMRGARLSRSL